MAQSCFEIESILVDACGTPEGTSEMVRFRVGAQTLLTSQLTVNWPNNGYQGICQNANTAAKVAQINGQITQCGLALEPINGQLPPGAQVLLITSENVNIVANSFANLSDTIYVIFQCAGNTQGHFANATSTGSRTLTMSFSSPNPCSDQVTYQCGLLVDQNGQTGSGSPASLRDGATVSFTPNGNATYSNAGCVVPVLPLFLNAHGPATACPGDTLLISANSSNALGGFVWSGGAGQFLSQGNDSVFYVVGAADVGNVTLQVSATNCNGNQVVDQYSFQSGNPPTLQLLPGPVVALCAGASVALQAVSNSPVQWLNGPATSSYTVNQPGTYVVQANNGCGFMEDSILVQMDAPPVVQIASPGNGPFCTNQPLPLQGALLAGNANQFFWQNTPSGLSTQANATGWYVFSAVGACGTDQDSIYLDFLPGPSLQITTSTGNNTVCAGDSMNLLAAGVGTIAWVNGPNASSWFVSQGGIYVAQATNSCGTIQDSIQVQVGTGSDLSLVGMADTVTCPQPFLDRSASASGPLQWSDGSTGPTLRLVAPGNFWVSSMGACGADTLFGSWQVVPVQAQAVLEPSTGSAPLTVVGTGVNGIHLAQTYWRWDGETQPGLSLEQTFSVPGSYVLWFVTINQLGCADSISFSVEVSPKRDFNLYIPLSFTPNEDGINDLFKIYGTDLVWVQATIFDRWGQEIYRWNGLENGWNGKKGAQLLPIGVYVLKVDAIGPGGANLSRVQNVHLIR